MNLNVKTGTYIIENWQGKVKDRLFCGSVNKCESVKNDKSLLIRNAREHVFLILSTMFTIRNVCE